ncbi:hypothetical protein KSS87_022906 [Heliosperma pusillum]|nr:hypothetical protein KSS87_022906 [Heliosperma pusillum]
MYPDEVICLNCLVGFIILRIVELYYDIVSCMLTSFSVVVCVGVLSVLYQLYCDDQFVLRSLLFQYEWRSMY